MAYIMVDVEADGPIPGDYSMVLIGAVIFEPGLARTFRGDLRPIFISDNNGYDWGFANWYLHHFAGGNPFGHSSQNLGSLYKGMVKDTRKNFKHLRQTRHTHDPVDDARGNAEALLHMRDAMGLGIDLGAASPMPELHRRAMGHDQPPRPDRGGR